MKQVASNIIWPTFQGWTMYKKEWRNHDNFELTIHCTRHESRRRRRSFFRRVGRLLGTGCTRGRGCEKILEIRRELEDEKILTMLIMNKKMWWHWVSTQICIIMTVTITMTMKKSWITWQYDNNDDDDEKYNNDDNDTLEAEPPVKVNVPLLNECVQA